MVNGVVVPRNVLVLQSESQQDVKQVQFQRTRRRTDNIPLLVAQSSPVLGQHTHTKKVSPQKPARNL